MIYTLWKEVVLSLQQTLLDHHVLDLQDWKATIIEVQTRKVTTQEMDASYCEKCTLHFITPTTFYQYGNYYPLPELNRLLGSAAKLVAIVDEWEIEKHQIEDWARNIIIESVEIKTERVSFGSFQIIGFCGKMTISQKKLSKADQSIVWRLIQYGALMGFGYKTAWGLGRVEVQTSNRPRVTKQIG